jgi:hypothetical protein
MSDRMVEFGKQSISEKELERILIIKQGPVDPGPETEAWKLLVKHLKEDQIKDIYRQQLEVQTLVLDNQIKVDQKRLETLKTIVGMLK